MYQIGKWLLSHGNVTNIQWLNPVEIRVLFREKEQNGKHWSYANLKKY
jgi:hypothetical protein